MPVHIVDEGLSDSSSNGGGGGTAPKMPSAAPAVLNPLANGSGSETAAAATVLTPTAGLALSNDEGGLAGMKVLLKILVARLRRVAQGMVAHSSSAPGMPIAEPAQHTGDAEVSEGRDAPDNKASAGDPSARTGSCSSFDAELLAFLGGAPLEASPLGQALAHFSAVYLFHMQQEIHSA